MNALDTSSGKMYQQQGAWCCHPDRVDKATSWDHQGGVASANVLIEIGRAAQPSRSAAAAETFHRPPSSGSDYPDADADKVADACNQIGMFRDTQGADQSEPLWRDCLGVVGHCVDGEITAHEWSRGHAGYDETATDKKLAYRLKTAPTTCDQFRKTNPEGCIGCTQTCKSPITLGWPVSEEFEVLDTETITPSSKPAVHAAQADPESQARGAAIRSSAILALNEKFAFIEENASIYRLGHSDFIDPAKFKLQHDNILVPVGRGHVGLGSAWLKSPSRRQHYSLVTRPGEDSVTVDNCLNEWTGFVIVPSPGDVKPFLRLLVRLMPNRAARRYAQRWMAHLIQRPGVKMFVSLAFWSHLQGVGKNLLFETLVSIIGPTHATVIGQAELTGAFNAWAKGRVLVVGDEVSGTDKRQEQDKLKGLITGSTVYVNEKYQPSRELINLLNFIFLSNHHDAFFLSDHDRRFFVWEIEAGRLPELQAKAFVAWRDSGGLAALHDFLLRYPIGDFNPKAPAPMTVAKQQMAEDNRSDFEAWLTDLLASDVALALGRELATASELGRKYHIDTDHKAPSSKAIVGAAKRMGVYARPSQVRLAKDRKARVLALARIDFWKQQQESAWAEEMQKSLAMPEL